MDSFLQLNDSEASESKFVNLDESSNQPSNNQTSKDPLQGSTPTKDPKSEKVVPEEADSIHILSDLSDLNTPSPNQDKETSSNSQSSSEEESSEEEDSEDSDMGFAEASTDEEEEAKEELKKQNQEEMLKKRSKQLNWKIYDESHLFTILKNKISSVKSTFEYVELDTAFVLKHLKKNKFNVKRTCENMQDEVFKLVSEEAEAKPGKPVPESKKEDLLFGNERVGKAGGKKGNGKGIYELIDLGSGHSMTYIDLKQEIAKQLEEGYGLVDIRCPKTGKLVQGSRITEIKNTVLTASNSK